jgi:hypothetical protein
MSFAKFGKEMLRVSAAIEKFYSRHKAESKRSQQNGA